MSRWLYLLVLPAVLVAQIASAQGYFDDPRGQWVAVPGTHGNAWQSLTFEILVTGADDDTGCVHQGVSTGHLSPNNPGGVLPLPETDLSTGVCLPEIQSSKVTYNALDHYLTVSVYAYFPTQQHGIIIRICDGRVGRTHSHIIKLIGFVGCHS